MSDYTRVYNFTIKDSLPTGDSGKVIKGTELDVELNAVSAAISSKSDSNSPTFTGTPAAPTASFGTNTTQLATTAFVQAALQALYPVGSVYINAAVTTNPATLFGFGTWVSVGDGKVLVNQDTTDTSFDTMGETGGSKDAIVVEHNHSATSSSTSTSTSTSTVTDPKHSHVFSQVMTSGAAAGSGAYSNTNYNGGGNTTSSASTGITVATSTTTNTSTTTTVANNGSSGTNANLQPYVVVKMWKRTA